MSNQWATQRELRKSLFDQTKTPKRAFSFWFFIFLLGQIGIVTSLIWAGISEGSIADTLVQQTMSGNFLTFEISLILSCLVYYFEEYGETPVRELFFLRSTLLILAMVVVFLAMLNYIYISTPSAPSSWPDWFVTYNVALYVAGVVLSYYMYITFSVVQPNVADDIREKTNNALQAAQSLPSTTLAHIGQKEINLGD